MKMLRRKVLPEEEELQDMVIPAAFAVVWYTMLLRAFLNHTTSGLNAAIFAAAGILPLYIAVVKGRAALSCREKRREATAGGRCCRGIIRYVIGEKVPFRGRRGHIYYRNRYYLMIEKLEEGFDSGMEIKTAAYRVPVHRYLKSREVKLYSDKSGWKWYVEEAQCGIFRQPSIVSEVGECDGESYVRGAIFRVIYIIILIFVLLQVIFPDL